MHSPDSNTIIEVFSGTSWEASLVQSLLSDAGIESFLKNNVMAEYLYNPVQADGVKVMILQKDLTEAKRVMEWYWRNVGEGGGRR